MPVLLAAHEALRAGARQVIAAHPVTRSASITVDSTLWGVCCFWSDGPSEDEVASLLDAHEIPVWRGSTKGARHTSEVGVGFARGFSQQVEIGVLVEAVGRAPTILTELQELVSAGEAKNGWYEELQVILARSWELTLGTPSGVAAPWEALSGRTRALVEVACTLGVSRRPHTRSEIVVRVVAENLTAAVHCLTETAELGGVAREAGCCDLVCERAPQVRSGT